MRHPTFTFALTLLALGLTGCGASQPPAVPADAPATQATEAAPGVMSVSPARLETCEPGAVVVVRWNMRPAHPEVSDVEIWTGPEGHQTIFAAGGYTGEASTGQPWAHPGTIFSLRNKADGVEVATAVVDGPSCGG